MAFTQDGSGFQPRKMFDVDVQCGQCGAKIDKLPFEPDPSRLSNILCRDCYRSKRQGQR